MKCLTKHCDDKLFFFLDLFRCGTHSGSEGYTIEQDLEKAYPHCCAKLVKVEKKSKGIDHFEASEVQLNKFRSRDQAEVLKQRKTAPKTPAKETKDQDATDSE